MASPIPSLVPRHIIVADENKAMVTFIITSLRAEGHAVVSAYDVLSATRLAAVIEPCDLLLSNSKFAGADGVALIRQLRQCKPALPIIYLANFGKSTPELEARLPTDVPILREPFTAEELREAVRGQLERTTS